MKSSRFLLFLIISAFVLPAIVSCDKGYELRFSNYYTEKIDSVIVGNNSLVFLNIEKQSSTDYKKIIKGQHKVTCVSKSKKRFNSSVFISGNGSGKKTIQIDGIGQISFLEN